VGLGLPWLISAIYAAKHDQPYKTPPGNLAFSVMLFLMCSLICFAILGIRRCVVGGELCGAKVGKMVSCVFCVGLWVTYVTFSTLKAYKVIDGI
jgi:solute carrier family 8 (sodium/calcium exchanger)